MQNDPRIYETHNLDLGAYLMLEGVRYLGCRIIIDPRREEPKAVLKFLDEKSICLDLERTFIGTREKRYREFNKHLLKEVHREIREFNRKLKTQVEE